MEQWRPVVGYAGLYEVSDHGRVRNSQNDRMKQPTEREGRLFVLLWKNNKCRLWRVHRLVLIAFVGPPPKDHECCHNDGNAMNNHLSNLRWGTPTENQADRVKHGTSNRGEQCGTAKLTSEQVRAIRADTRTQEAIAATYGIRASQVSRIKNRVRWAHLD